MYVPARAILIVKKRKLTRFPLWRLTRTSQTSHENFSNFTRELENGHLWCLLKSYVNATFFANNLSD